MKKQIKGLLTALQYEHKNAELLWHKTNVSPSDNKPLQLAILKSRMDAIQLCVNRLKTILSYETETA